MLKCMFSLTSYVYTTTMSAIAITNGLAQADRETLHRLIYYVTKAPGRHTVARSMTNAHSTQSSRIVTPESFQSYHIWLLLIRVLCKDKDTSSNIKTLGFCSSLVCTHCTMYRLSHHHPHTQALTTTTTQYSYECSLLIWRHFVFWQCREIV